MVKNIQVVIHQQKGGFSLVYIHRCSAIIDLPEDGYTGFQEYRVQMENKLKSP